MEEEKRTCKKCSETKIIEEFPFVQKKWRAWTCKACRSRDIALDAAVARYRKYFDQARIEVTYLAIAEMCKEDKQLFGEIVSRYPEKYKEARRKVYNRKLAELKGRVISKKAGAVRKLFSAEELWAKITKEYGFY